MADKPAASTNLDMFTMVVLRRRIEAIIREMTNALFRSGRSGVLNTAMDFSCSLTDAQFRSISVALGLTNLLPIPALDGGRILFQVVELIRGKPMDPEREGMVHFVGLMILLGLMVVLVINDLSNPISLFPPK